MKGPHARTRLTRRGAAERAPRSSQAAWPRGRRSLRVALLCILAALPSALSAQGSRGPAAADKATVQAAPETVTIRFEGGVASATYGEVMAELGRQGLVPLVPHVDEKGGTPADILRDTERLVGSTVAPAFEEYLCAVNPHVCARTKAGRYEWRNGRAPADATAPTEGCPSRALPRYVLCVPAVSIRTYRTTVLVPYDPKQENLRDLVSRRGGCEALDDRCTRTIRNLNKEDVLSPSYPGGRIRLPSLAYALTLSVRSEEHLERIVQTVDKVRDTLDDRKALTVDKRSLFYTVPSAVQKQDSHVPAPVGAGGVTEAAYVTLLQRMGYPYVQPDSFPAPLGRVLIGVWDSHVDDGHCGFVAGGRRAVVVSDYLPRSPADPPQPQRVGACGSVRQALEERWDHGTHVAGIIGARRQGLSMFGVNPRASLWVYETDSRGKRLEDDDDPIAKLASMIDDSHPIPTGPPALVNLSFRHKMEDRPTRLERIIESYRRDTLFVAAAGNDGREIRQSSQCRIIPACLTADRDSESGDNVLSVVALNATGQDRWTNAQDPAVGSNYGPVFDVAAIGQAVSTLFGNAYGTLDGTSVATPYVTGLASLVQVQSRARSPKEVKERILYTADFSDTLDRLVAFGRINFRRALALEHDALTLKDCGSTACELQPVDVRKEPSDEVRIVEGQRDGRDLQAPVTLKVRDIRRLAAAHDSPQSRYWVIYVDELKVLRKIREARFEGTPQLRLAGDRRQPLSGIRDYTCAIRCGAAH